MEEEPVYKPRQTRGTPAYRFSYKFGFVVGVAFFSANFLIAYLCKDRLYRKIASGFYDPSEHTKKRRKIMSNLKAVPNSRDASLHEYEYLTSTIENDADNPMDLDLE